MLHMDFTFPRIVTSDNLKTRSYIVFYFRGQRIREYTGDSIELDIKPNGAKSIKERYQLLKRLEYELTKALENKTYLNKSKSFTPLTTIEQNYISTKDHLDNALNKKVKSNINRKYKVNLRTIHEQFKAFLTNDELCGKIEDITSTRIDEFLSNYSSSGTYYMNKRRDLGVLFSTINKQLKYKTTVVQDSDKMRSYAKLHKIYETGQLNPILNYLKDTHKNLYLCCLITYSTFLRPHHEVRNLKLSHIKNDCREIHLSGEENKGKKIRIVYIPDYLRNELLPIIKDLNINDSIFSRTTEIPNEYYFSTSWTRIFKKMFKKGLIEKNQTIYSFRHTAAVQVYNKTKDLHILQQLLGHSDMIVTLKYLRGLAAIKNEDLKDVMPTL